jgi:hypothetical protein
MINQLCIPFFRKRILKSARIWLRVCCTQMYCSSRVLLKWTCRYINKFSSLHTYISFYINLSNACFMYSSLQTHLPVFRPSNFGIRKMYGYSCKLPGATGVMVVRGYQTRTSYKTVMALQKERLKCFDADSAARVSSNLRQVPNMTQLLSRDKWHWPHVAVPINAWVLHSSTRTKL